MNKVITAVSMLACYFSVTAALRDARKPCAFNSSLRLTATISTTAVPRTWCLIIRPRPSRWVASRHPQASPTVPVTMLKTTWCTNRLHAYTLKTKTQTCEDYSVAYRARSKSTKWVIKSSKT